MLELAVAAAAEEPPQSSPPTTPAVGACYIVGPAPTGSWAGHPNYLAAYTSGGWRMVGPVEGMQVRIRSSGLIASFEAGAWQAGTVAATKIVIGGQQVVSGRGAAVTPPAGGAVVDVEVRNAVSAILSRLKEHGLIA